MKAIFQISTSNQLRFVNRTSYYNTPETFDTRLFNHLTFQDRDYVPYSQKIQNDDDCWFDFKTSYTDFNLYLVNKSDSSKTTLAYSVAGNETTLTDGTILIYYRCNVDVTALDGCYYIECECVTPTLPYQIIWSEEFNVKEEHENTLIIKWGGNSSINDGMNWASVPYEIDRYQQMRIEARIIDPDYDSEKDTYNDSNMEQTTQNDDQIGLHTIDIKLIPFYLHQKIKVALGHDEFYANNVLYNTDEDWKLDKFKEQLMRTGNIQLRVVDYENYNNYTELTGDLPVFADAYFLINATDNMLINATDKMKLNN